MPSNKPASTMPLEEKVAQLFMLGYEGETPNPVMFRFLEAGLGGIIFFRDNFQHMSQANQVAGLLKALQEKRKTNTPELFLSLDQEGGQVERLPHTVFPSLITPRAIGLSKDPETLAKQTYTVMARHLAALGFNFNYAPTLDVNLEPKNPIIGTRAFGDDAKHVWKLGKIAIDCLWQEGIIPVGKHFPGHGNGTVDSHYKLPHLTYTKEEFSTFQSAIDDDIPVMLVSHGFYPALQKNPNEFETPASASKTIIHDLLIQTCGFKGLVISDDMCMGAITQEKDPVEAAITSLEAGIDLLVYKQSTDEEWAIYQGVIQAVQSGRLSQARIDEAYAKITALKQRHPKSETLKTPEPSDWDKEYLASQSRPIATEAITVLQKSELALNAENSYLLLHPNRNSITNYRFDQPTSAELPELLKQAGFGNITDIAYTVETPGNANPHAAIAQLPNKHYAGILFVTFNPLIQPIQQKLFETLKQQYPDTPVLLISAGTAYDKQLFQNVDGHIALCTYRPPTMQALASFLAGKTYADTCNATIEQVH